MHDEPMNSETRDISTPEGKPDPQGSSRRIVIVVLGLLAVAILLIFVLWVGPSALTRHPTKGLTIADWLKAENDVRTALVATIIALGALAGLVFTALNLRVSQRTLRATFQSLEDARATQRGAEKAQQETLRMQRESQIAERYSKAVEQLGNQGASDVRTGAVYALEQIASDWPEKYHQPVVEMLAAFLREHADKTHGPELDALAAHHAHLLLLPERNNDGTAMRSSHDDAGHDPSSGQTS